MNREFKTISVVATAAVSSESRKTSIAHLRARWQQASERETCRAGRFSRVRHTQADHEERRQKKQGTGPEASIECAEDG